MTTKQFSLNKSFKELLQLVEDSSIKRRDLIQLAVDTTELNTLQSTRFVARHVNVLTSHNLITASGKRNARMYHFTDSLLTLLNHETKDLKLTNSHFETRTPNYETLLKREEAKTSAELKMTLGEIEAYRDLMTQYPTNRQVIEELLCEAKDQSTQLYGRLNALRKVIKATNQESRQAC
ncbi:hypothetical protein ACIGBN_11980 [Marinomonas sp. NPDC078689]|uniref:hypothetical protein n=1 Tax=Marinomonas sp. NPDC078689 TaxID=3364147 RepID=UPI0037CC57CE